MATTITATAMAMSACRKITVTARLPNQAHHRRSRLFLVGDLLHCGLVGVFNRFCLVGIPLGFQHVLFVVQQVHALRRSRSDQQATANAPKTILMERYQVG